MYFLLYKRGPVGSVFLSYCDDQQTHVYYFLLELQVLNDLD